MTNPRDAHRVSSPGLRILRAAAAATLLATPALALAGEPPRATLDYARQGRTATECPDEATFRALVAAKLGYDPFGPGASSSLRVVFRRSGSELDGTLTLTSGGTARGERTLRSAGEGCDELAASLALAAAVAVDPDAVANHPGEGTPPPAPEPAATTPTPPPPSNADRRTAPAVLAAEPSAPPPGTLGARLGATLFAAAGLTPSFGIGARLGAGLDGGSWQLGLEGGITLGGTQTTDAGSVTANLFDAALVPCLVPGLTDRLGLALCAVGRVGVLSSDAKDVTRASPEQDLVFYVGPRARLEYFPSRWLGLGFELEAPIALTRVHLMIDDQGERREVWASSRVGAAAGASMIFRLW